MPDSGLGDQTAIRPAGRVGRVLIGVSVAAWVLTFAVTVLMLIALAAGELEGMAVLSGIVIVAFALFGALLLTGATALQLYLARRRRVPQR